MGQLLLLLAVALTVAAVVFGVAVLVTGSDPGLAPAEPDGRVVPLPGSRPLRESDVGEVRFDTAVRGYRMAQVDQAMRRTAYDIGYKDELIGVLEAEVTALREGRTADAEALRRAREAALGPAGPVSGDGAGSAPAANGAVVVRPTVGDEPDRPGSESDPGRGGPPAEESETGSTGSTGYSAGVAEADRAEAGVAEADQTEDGGDQAEDGGGDRGSGAEAESREPAAPHGPAVPSERA